MIGAREAHGVLGRDVRSPTDEDMGHIVDVIVDPGFKQDMYVTAIETRPIHVSAYKVIHHATTNVIEDEDDRRILEADFATIII